jgi:hypothetical protein
MWFYIWDLVPGMGNGWRRQCILVVAGEGDA